MQKLVYGFGINDSKEPVKLVVDGQIVYRCPVYVRWIAILERCYSRSLHKRRPTYKGCWVSESWRKFSDFKAWIDSQEWDGKYLDKDLLIYGNKEYGPETCVFVDLEVNNFLTKRDSCRGTTPIGVRLDGKSGMYRATISRNSKQTHLGTFTCPLQAHIAWQEAKIQEALRLSVKYEGVVRVGLANYANRIREDLLQNLVTI